jgi:hypothetical protein
VIPPKKLYDEDAKYARADIETKEGLEDQLFMFKASEYVIVPADVSMRMTVV